MKTYPSKIGMAILLPVLATMLGVGCLMAYERIWPGLALMLLLAAFILHMLLTTRYTIQGNDLTIQCGFFLLKTIRIDTIRSIKESNSILSAPAASFDRLLIAYNKYDTMIVSPKEKAAFVAHLTGINPAIQVTMKNAIRR